jgi:RNA polymerase sigma-70 factor (ECF subfamily)
VRSGSPAEPAHDAALISAYLAGDHEAFGELFQRHQGHLWAVSLRICGNPDDAADALQDGLIRAMRGANQFQGRAAAGTWLHRIITNAAIDLLRARHPVVGLDELPELIDRTEPSQESWETGMDLERAFAAIPAEARVALYLVDYEGWTVAEAAATLGVAPGTIKSRCSRGRARLAPLLPGYGNRAGPPDVKPSQPPNGPSRATPQRSHDE